MASGASHARNLGASQARAPYLLFLDADDWLDPECLAVMTDAEARNGYDVAVYTDYICLSHIEPSLAEDLKKKRRLLEYRHGHAASLSHAFEYDPARAMRQPDVRDPYLWCLISSYRAHDPTEDTERRHSQSPLRTCSWLQSPRSDRGY